MRAWASIVCVGLWVTACAGQKSNAIEIVDNGRFAPPPPDHATNPSPNAGGNSNPNPNPNVGGNSTANTNPPPPVPTGPQAQPAAPGAPTFVDKRGRWQPIAAPQGFVRSRAEPKGQAVGRHMFARQGSSNQIASYDPCKRTWLSHGRVPYEYLSGNDPLVLDDTHVEMCCKKPKLTGVVVDVTSTQTSPIPPYPRTPRPGRFKKPLEGGYFVPADRRFRIGKGWTVVNVPEQAAVTHRQTASATASGGPYYFTWGGLSTKPGLEGSLFDGRSNQWRPIATRGAPGPRPKGRAIWTGREFFVYGGAGVRQPGGPREVTRVDGGLYDPVGDRWRPIKNGPAFDTTLDGMVDGSGELVIVWDLERGATYNLRTGEWRQFALPERTYVQNRVKGDGTLVIFTKEHVNVLDPARLAWRRFALPAKMKGRSGRVQVASKTHIMVWAGKESRGTGGCGKGSPNPCDPYVKWEYYLDGAALQVGSCRG